MPSRNMRPPPPPQPLRKRRAAAGGPRAGPAGRWHCNQGESSRRAPRVAAAAGAKQPFHACFPLLPLRPCREKRKKINGPLVTCDGRILAAEERFFHAKRNLPRNETAGAPGMAGNRRRGSIGIWGKQGGGGKSLCLSLGDEDGRSALSDSASNASRASIFHLQPPPAPKSPKTSMGAFYFFFFFFPDQTKKLCKYN